MMMMEALIGGGFTLVSLFIGYCITEVRRVKTEVVKIVEREKFESVMAQRRIDVLDSVASDISEYKFNSRHVVEKGHDLPKVHSTLRKIIHSGGDL